MFHAFSAHPVSWLVGFLWLLWATVWLAAAVWTAGIKRRPVERREWRTTRLSVLLLAIPAVLIWNLRPVLGWWDRPLLPHALALPGLLVSATGFAFSIWARIALNRNWSGMAVLRSGHELVRKGPYRMVRHPIYTGLLLALAGTVIALGLPPRWIALWLLILAALWLKITGEEKLLAERFGPDFESFRRSTPALVPHLVHNPDRSPEP
jgi:protein-S-isoprenylcysteine O-methyltransferase Ste14